MPSRLENGWSVDLFDGSLDQPFLTNGFTFGDVFGLASRLRERLHETGGSEKPFLLVTQDRALVMAALLQALNGGPPVLLPYSPALPALSGILAASGAETIVTDGQQEMPAIRRIIEVHLDKRPVSAFSPPHNLDEPILYLYTGGSTGQPQAWPKTGRNLLEEAAFLTKKFNVSVNDRFLSTVPPQHIYGLLFSVLVPFFARCAVVSETPLFPGEIISKLHSAACSVLISAPAHIRALGQTVWQVSALRAAFSSGGFLDEQDGGNFFARTGVGIVEVYGILTETGGIATRARTNKESAWTPFSPVRWKISHERLCVASPFLSPGLPLDSEGYFETGDQASPASSDTFHLLGRVDGVVKVGGKRVHLGEVETKLRQLAYIHDAYVFSIQSMSSRENEIVALIVSERSEEETRRALEKVLPAEAIPRRLRCVKEIPAGAAGKRDRAEAERLLNAQP